MQLTRSITAIVTGGASGLGEATARELAAAGCRVTIFDRDKDRGSKVAASVEGLFCEVDVTNEQNVVDAFAQSRAAFGQERILVCCAGIGIAIKTASRKKESNETVPHPSEHFERIIQINLIGTFRCVAKAAAGMLTLAPVTEDGERGVLINTGSIAAQDGQIGQVAYSASKGGIVGMTLPIARDLSRDGIRCCTILPGLFATPLMNAAPEDVKRSLSSSIPFPSRFGNPSEYARLARHICENSMLNGEVIRLDGALRMPPR